jgi:hypothetical protein
MAEPRTSTGWAPGWVEATGKARMATGGISPATLQPMVFVAAPR